MSDSQRHRQPVGTEGTGYGRLAREGTSYLIVGFLQLGLDWTCFVVLSAIGIPVAAANVAGRAVGAVLGYFLNAKHTFADSTGKRNTLSGASMVKFVISWIVVAAISTVLVVMLDQTHGLKWAWIGKPVVDGLLAVLGFLLSKYWIFR